MLTAPPGSQTLKDPRPIRDRAYQSKMRQEIFAWLQTTEYEISMQTLMSITGKDYRSMFQHLVNLVDPCYPFDPKARFEDEFQPALRAFRYPFVSQLDNKWLAAPGSMHSWPTLLAVLHWLVQMGKVCSSRLADPRMFCDLWFFPRRDYNTWKATIRHFRM